VQKCLAALLAAAILLTGCSGSGNMKALDKRMDNPSILENDNDLRTGDLGVEEHRKTRRPELTGSPFSILQSNLSRTSPNPAISPQNGSYANNVISFGSLFMGAPYEYGSERYNTDSFDCSDFTHYSFLGALGMELPLDSRSQAAYVDEFGSRKYTDLAYAQRGDLLFFMDYKGPRPEDYRGINPANERITHCGIYMGDGQMIHTASRATGGVRIDNVWGKHLEYRFVRGGSVLP
jgi:peptidoglycan DL-endopeptidase CwlO